MTLLSSFLIALKAIIALRPTYRTGGTGADGTCDCVGLIMGAMYRCGHARYGLHGSNYFARNEMQELVSVSSPTDCYPGMVIYKAREPSDSGYSLPERYNASPDRRDYYHVGVVTSIMPFTITHCTSAGSTSGIMTDSKLGKWRYGGRLKDIDYENTDITNTPTNNTVINNSQEAITINNSQEAILMNATVTAANGKPVNLRKGPSTSTERLARVPVGTPVAVTEHTDDWATVEWNGLHGYMMMKFLQLEEGTDTATIEERLKALEDRVSALEERLTPLEELLAEPRGGDDETDEDYDDYDDYNDDYNNNDSDDDNDEEV